jgi:hypothetical protein
MNTSACRSPVSSPVSSPVTPPKQRRAALLAPLGLALALSATASGQKAVIALETLPGSHNIATIEETTLEGTLVQSGVELRPLSLAGFALRDRLRADVPTVRGLSGPLPHVRLPDHGSLYLSTQGPAICLLQVDAEGRVTTRFKARRHGTDVMLSDTIAVSPGGRRALVATSPWAGGNAHVIHLDSRGPSFEVTQHLPPLAIEPDSLRLGPDDLWFIAGNRLFHAQGAAQATPVHVALPAGAIIQPETAMSGDGRSLALIIDDPGAGRLLMVIGASGASSWVQGAPADYDTPTLDQTIGPLLALSHDGSCVAWRQTVISKELFVQRVEQASLPEQVTRDAQFTDTIDSVGVLGFVGDGRLVFAAGEAQLDPESPIGSADFFLVDMTGPLPAPPVNLTLTSGVAQAPFLVAGELEVKEAVLDPRGERLLVRYDPTGGDDAVALLDLDNAQSFTPLLPALETNLIMEAAGDHVLFISTPPQPAPYLTEVHLLRPRDVPGVPLVFAGGTNVPGFTFDRFTSDRRGLLAAFVASLGPGMSVAVQVEMATAQLRPLWHSLFEVSPTLAYTQNGMLTMGLGPVGGPFVWLGFSEPQKPLPFPLPPSLGFPLEN